MVDDTRDKVIALEADVKHLTAAVESMSVKVSEIHDLLQQAKGARWIIIASASVGGFLAGKLAWLIPWLSGAPRL